MATISKAQKHRNLFIGQALANGWTPAQGVNRYKAICPPIEGKVELEFRLTVGPVTWKIEVKLKSGNWVRNGAVRYLSKTSLDEVPHLPRWRDRSQTGPRVSFEQPVQECSGENDYDHPSQA